MPPLSPTRTTIVRTHSALRNAKATASDKPPERKCSSSDNFSQGKDFLYSFVVKFRTSGVVVSRGLRHFLFPRRGEPPRGGLVSLVLRKVKSVWCFVMSCLSLLALVAWDSKIYCRNCLTKLGVPLPAHGRGVALFRGSGEGFPEPK